MFDPDALIARQFAEWDDLATFWMNSDYNIVDAVLSRYGRDEVFIVLGWMACTIWERGGTEAAKQFIQQEINPRKAKKKQGVTPDTRMHMPTLGENPPASDMPVFVPNIGGKP